MFTGKVRDKVYKFSPSLFQKINSGGSFSTGNSNKGGVSADSLAQPVGACVGSDGVYIADSGNNRVLFFSGNFTTAVRVYGQGKERSFCSVHV